MRAARVAFVCVLASCSSFSAEAPREVAADAGGQDAGIEGAGSQDGAAAADAAVVVLPGTVGVVTREKDDVRAIGVDPTSIYWWSVRDSRIAKASKANLRDISLVVARPGQSVTALSVDVNGLYWLEEGPDEAGISSRIMTKVGTDVRVLVRSGASLPRLALDPIRVATLTSSSVISVNRQTEAPGTTYVSTDQSGLVVDGINLFFTFGGSAIYRLAAGLTTGVMSGLSTPRELAVDGTSVYAVVAGGAGSEILKVDKTRSNQQKADAVRIATTPPGKVYLALEGINVVWANNGDGTIQRVTVSGGDPTPLASGVAGLNAIAADSDGAYWTADDGSVSWARR
jgi:hypothetical protein